MREHSGKQRRPVQAKPLRGQAAVIHRLENRVLLSAATADIVAGVIPADVAQETLLGVFGIVNGKRTSLKVNLDSTHTTTFSLTGGSATALQGDTGIDLEVTDISGAILTVTVTHRGSISFGDINVTGNLKTFNAAAGVLAGTLSVSGEVGHVDIGAIPGNVTIASGVSGFVGGDLAGTFAAGGNIGSLRLGAVSGNVNVGGNILSLRTTSVGGTIYSGGELGRATVGALTGRIVSASVIENLTAASMTGATVLAGANLGSDGLLGGTGSAEDSFASGTIDALDVTGGINSSFIGAGVAPFDGTFGSGNDTSAGVGLVKLIHARSADAATRFESSAFGVADLPRRVDVVTDPRFIIL
jgi:hypothetical protein